MTYETPTGANMFAYCMNNPVVSIDIQGKAAETIFDVLSLGASIMEVAFNPSDPYAWLGLAGDAVDLVPFVTGVGETIRALKFTSGAITESGEVIGKYHKLKKLNNGSGLEVHHIVEKRFSKMLGFGKTGSSMPSIALPQSKHRDYTTKWRQHVPYGTRPERKEVLSAAISIYADDPEMLGAAIYTIVKFYE